MNKKVGEFEKRIKKLITPDEFTFEPVTPQQILRIIGEAKKEFWEAYGKTNIRVGVTDEDKQHNFEEYWKRSGRLMRCIQKWFGE